MKKQAVNPYLPFWETVPDGEPYVFDGRVYVFGSHDKVGDMAFCTEDYVLWSAPIDNLGDWTCHGIIYKKEQDPLNGAPYEGKLPAVQMPIGTPEHLHDLYAPDMCQGPDGRYYLYYALDFMNVISVAASDKVTGPYEFLDFVRKEDGSIPDLGVWFDPGILCEEGGNYLYYGLAPVFKFPGMEHLVIPGALMVKLADDMHTIISEPVCVANGIDTAKGTDYEEHPFLEAASIRHYGSWYYFVYSSSQGHELCYGMSRTPEGPFAYKGVIVSNADLGYEGNELPVNYYGNNHGGLVNINGTYYIFWHRQTHGTSFARQGCADPAEILADGTIPQIEITSCGLNQGPLLAKGKHEAYIACHLTEGDRENVKTVLMPEPGFEGKVEFPETMTYITEEADPAGEHGLKPFIFNMRTGALAGFKYFTFDGEETEMEIELRGRGTVEIRLDAPEGMMIGEALADCAAWTNVKIHIAKVCGTHAIYFRVKEGRVDFASFEIK